jgi:hypothetical protein
MWTSKFKFHLIWFVASHIESTTLDDGDYELVLGQDQGFPEDPAQVVEGLTEVPNPSSEISDSPAPTPTPEGKPRTYPIILSTLQSILIYIISCIKSRSWSETLDAWILAIQCNAPESLSDSCSANRTGRSRVISCHSRGIGVACLHFCNHYKDDGQGHVLYHDLEVYPVCFDKSFKVEKCGSGGYVFESTSHMPRNMVSGKPSNQSAR